MREWFRKLSYRTLFRDIFLGTIALVILYDQVFIAAHAQPLLIFVVFFLFASIPALRGDQSTQPSMFARFVMYVLGIQSPNLPDEHNSSTRSQNDTPTSADSPESSFSPPSDISSSKSSLTSSTKHEDTA